MFYLEIRDDYGAVTDGSDHDTLDEALREIEDQVKNGARLDNIKLYKEVELSFTIDVEVKD